MTMNKKHIICLAVALLCIGGVSAQSFKKFEYRVKAGFNIGGTTPLPLPAEIRKLKEYSPTLAFAIEGNVVRNLTAKWALISGLRFETKGMSAGAQVKNYQLTMNVDNGDEQGLISGVFTGQVKTRVQNEYLTVPVMAMRQVSPRWELKLGFFFSYLLRGGFSGNAYDGYIRDGDPTGTKIGVESATYQRDVV